MANQMGYAAVAPEAEPAVVDVDHAKRKREFLLYLSVKDAEIREQQNARRYYHGVQYTAEQIKVLNKRKQPVVTYNRIGRKINALVGLLERQKQDPRGYPRTPKHEEGAEVATATLRYVTDEQRWPEKSLTAGLNGGVDGLAGVELNLVPGDTGDVDIGLEDVDPSSFFYDPRSLKPDFSDARYMGVGKWADVEATVAMFPDKEAEIRASVDTGAELTSDPDSDQKQWYSSSETRGNRLRLVDHWYLVGNDWFWCIYTGFTVLASGSSYLRDEKNRSICKYLMFSANVDQDGDRYGFVRNMKSSQDEINQRRSKGLHTLNSRRIFIEQGSGNDVEHVRKEMARPDGVIEYIGQPPTPDDGAKGQELQGHLAFLEDAKNEIENYGFNPALVGQGTDQLSGRAMQFQQQAGIAELGPYLSAFKNWKLRVYRAIWGAIQQHWTGERWIRVTDDQDLAQFFAVNQMGIDPNTGMPALVNALGSLDVDIIIDEGPDTINMQQDAYDTLSLMAQKGVQVPPQLLIELSPLPGSVKKKANDILEKAQQQAAQPDPMAQAGQQAEINDINASAKLKEAQTVKALADANAAAQPQPGSPGPTMLDSEETLANIRNKDANTAKTIAETRRTQVETMLKPAEVAHQQREADLSRQERFAMHRDQLSHASQE
jgi:hypothetical protein